MERGNNWSYLWQDFWQSEAKKGAVFNPTLVRRRRFFPQKVSPAFQHHRKWLDDGSSSRVGDEEEIIFTYETLITEGEEFWRSFMSRKFMSRTYYQKICEQKIWSRKFDQKSWATAVQCVELNRSLTRVVAFKVLQSNIQSPTIKVQQSNPPRATSFRKSKFTFCLKVHFHPSPNHYHQDDH